MVISRMDVQMDVQRPILRAIEDKKNSRLAVYYLLERVEPPNGFEPLTCCLRIKRWLTYTGQSRLTPTSLPNGNDLLYKRNRLIPTYSVYNRQSLKMDVQMDVHIASNQTALLLASVGGGRFSTHRGVRLN